jgi:hypothetical protein
MIDKTRPSLEQRVEQEPVKVKPAWDLARVTLEAYLSRNLNHITVTFWLHVFVIVAGFATIIWGAAQAINTPESTPLVVMTGLASVIAAFIRAAFLLHRSTIQQFTNHTQTLERMNSVGMAMQILYTMPDSATPANLKNATKAVVVKMLMQQSPEVEVPSLRAGAPLGYNGAQKSPATLHAMTDGTATPCSLSNPITKHPNIA